MKKLFLRIFVFMIIGYLIGEVVVRYFKLTSDIPQRYVDKSGIQHFIPGQKGFYKKSDFQWKVNKYGWLGVSNFQNKKRKISIIGDSYIENLMSPDSCNQGYRLQKEFKDVGFLEVGRSGISFIETMEIAKDLDTLGFNNHLIYVGTADFTESISNLTRYPDRVQVDLDKGEILKAEMKSPGLKKILYNAKFLYYLYLRFPIFVSEQNKNNIFTEKSKTFENESYIKLFEFCESHYNLKPITLVFHPGSSEEIMDLAAQHGFKILRLEEKTDQTWDYNDVDPHWSCFGNREAAKQVATYLQNEILNP